ncbi:U2 snRNP-associated SURP domain-containing protein [Actinomortierella ambigua]|uniref:U2 snRNP-associated SURP domain-containing protein n=1 Tax=Actinomortierella ambigua TaxID=1343610 RepID=A0A9P6UC03_9FUNG|nr:U2 snRNP-associated SURP domain-containing protein [Actinomortierella ambigua]
MTDKRPGGLKPSTAQIIAESKVQGFTIGSHKRLNPFQKHKEEAELKRKKESEETAKAYADFVASFEGDNSKKERKFVKGKSVFGQDDDDDDDDVEKVDARASKPAQDAKPVVTASAPQLPPEPTPVPKDTKAEKRKEMDAFLEGLKRDTGDPTTTNLYIGNINPTVNEEQLCMEFAKYGPIASIKIMWPRTQEEIDRNRNCGFVSFMERQDAAQALKDMDGIELCGYVMKLGWGKAVPLPAVPFYQRKDYKAPPMAKRVLSKKAVPPASHDVVVEKPTDPAMVVRIHKVIERVLVIGPEFEQALIDHEVVAEDERLIDVPLDDLERTYTRGSLSRHERSYFEALLRLLTAQRRSIARAMVFAIQHAEAADEIVDILSASMLLDSTPQGARLARLYLISDILHNSSASIPNVWKFRSRLEGKLPAVFEKLNEIYRSIDARLKAEQFRRQVAGVLSIWENWIVFPQEYLDQLAATLVRRAAGEQAEASTIPPSVPSTASGRGDGGSSSISEWSQVQGHTPDGDLDVDGEPMEDDIDGVPMEDDDIDGMPL